MGSLRGAIKERGSMIIKDMLDNFRRSISVGETLKIENPFTANLQLTVTSAEQMLIFPGKRQTELRILKKRQK